MQNWRIVRELWNRRKLRLLQDERGQVLALALIVIALGVMFIGPYLTHVTVNLFGTNKAHEKILDRYSVDAGAEWGMWKAKNDATFAVGVSSYSEALLQPTPPSLNDDPFPTTEIRHISGTGVSQTTPLTPGSGNSSDPECYTVTLPDNGAIIVVVDVNDPSARVWIDLTTSAPPPCSVGGVSPLPSADPYVVEFSNLPAGTFYVVIKVAPWSAVDEMYRIDGSLAIYDVRSQKDGRTVEARFSAMGGIVKVISWQLD